jgi:hypothetical protein
MLVVGGLIVGNPDDGRESIDANLAFARRYVDWPYIQHPMPYPGTPMTADFARRQLIVNTRVEEYDGTTAVTRSAHLSTEEIEFMRWKAERWMKVRHMPRVLLHDPGFVLRNGRRMLAHTFRGSTWRSWMGLESSRAVFNRYRRIREREREYAVWPNSQTPSVVGVNADAYRSGEHNRNVESTNRVIRGSASYASAENGTHDSMSAAKSASNSRVSAES